MREDIVNNPQVFIYRKKEPWQRAEVVTKVIGIEDTVSGLPDAVRAAFK